MKKLIMIIVALSVLLFALSCSGAKSDTIKIGCVLSTTGLLGPKGLDRLNAAKLAVLEINARGGVLNQQVELVEADDGTDPDKCLTRVKNMVEKDGVQVLMGGMSSDAVLAYHTALEFHGKAYSVHTSLHYLSAQKSLPL